MPPFPYNFRELSGNNLSLTLKDLMNFLKYTYHTVKQRVDGIELEELEDQSN